MTRKTAFTLIELLVVIAIIAILAAIIFPVFMRAKEAAYRAGDLSNMNALRNGLQLYRADQEAYPPQLLGYVTLYASGPQMNQVIPASSLAAALYPRRVDSVQTFRPAYDRVSDSLVTYGTMNGIQVGGTNTSNAVVWPPQDSRTVGQNPIIDTNGDGLITNADDVPGARQAYGTASFFCTNTASCVNYSTQTAADAAPLYMISGYDVADVKTPPTGERWEIHYTLRWTSYAFGGGNRSDDPRQLIYSEPPDNTVVTWDSWFRDYDTGNVTLREKKDFVLFLNGGARPYDSARIGDQSWRATP